MVNQLYKVQKSETNTTMKTKCIMLSPAAGLLLTLNIQPTTSTFAQGSLTPPGAPAPMMKTLQQIEPRTPISALPFTISAPGAYYIVTNMTGVAGANGVTISADNVDLDFGGFTLTGVANSLSGVGVPNNQINVSIRNGNICNWGSYGINASKASSAQLEQLMVSSNGAGGLVVGNTSSIGHCAALGNQGNGISGGSGAIIAECVSSLNQGWGISASNNSTLRNCVSTGNINTNTANSAGSWTGGGITVGNGCALTGCSANSNTLVSGSVGISTGSDCMILGCIANYNWPFPGIDGAYGISAGASCHIKDSTANGNALGIGTGTNCYVQDCIACNNIGGSSGDGISIGDFSCVRGCVAQNNKFSGIATGHYCSVFDNTCTANLGNGFGQIDLSSGSHSTAVHNFVVTNASDTIGIRSTATDAVGTLESATSLNTNKNPHANFRP
jgi:hypothetical protein